MIPTLMSRARRAALWTAALAASLPLQARADAVTDWTQKADGFIAEARIGTPPAVRIMALAHTAVRDAVERAGRDPVAIDAAVASAHRGVLARLLPSQEAAIAAAQQAAIARLPDGPARAAGIAAGEQAAAAVLAARADDSVASAERYRPHAAAGTYVPTAAVAAPQWPQRKPWLLASPAQFRPGPPPALASAAWARDYEEVRTLGGRASSARSAEQAEVARFWEYSLPAIYHGLLRSVAERPGRDVLRNARLHAAAAQAMDDGLIAVFDAKYHHHFWRPATAIRNGDIDGNDATVPEPGWLPLVEAPLHPEYPSAHSVLVAAVVTVLQADAGGRPLTGLSTTSPLVKGVVRRWNRADDLVDEVANARVHGGLHYRFSTDAGVRMGRQIGAMAAATLQPAD